MGTPYREDCSQGLAHICKGLFSIQNGRLSTNIKLALYKALIRPIMIYTRPKWEYVAHA
jgi:hypothetical protein